MNSIKNQIIGIVSNAATGSSVSKTAAKVTVEPDLCLDCFNLVGVKLELTPVL